MSRITKTLANGLLLMIALSLAPTAWAVPMWTRRYNVPCSGCHAYPSLQLTSAGLDFFRKGHRFDTDTFDKDLSHLIATHIETEYDVAKGTSSQFTKPDFHFHVGGAVSEYFSAYVDAKVNSDFEALYAQATKVLSKDSFVTARAGKLTPTIIRNYANGLMASASTPMIVTDTTLGLNPFTPARDSFGVTAAGGWKSLFLEAGVVNGEDIPGQVRVGGHKDTYASGEIMLPDGVSGVGLYTFRGGYDIEDPSVAAFDRYNRSALFANWTRNAFRLAGAYLTGKDKSGGQPDQKISGYYAQADLQTINRIVPFVRYESTRTDTGSDVERQRKEVIGLSVNAFSNDASGARITLEGARSSAAGTHTNSGLINLIFAF